VSIEKDIYSLLSASTSLSSAKIYPNVAVQESATPFIVYRKVSSVRPQTHGGAAGVATARFQVSVYSTSYTQAKSIAAGVQAKLEGHTSSTGSVRIQGIFYDNEVDLFDTSLKNTGLYHIATDYRVQHY
jgi:hypothetical protein